VYSGIRQPQFGIRQGEQGWEGIESAAFPRERGHTDARRSECIPIAVGRHEVAGIHEPKTEQGNAGSQYTDPMGHRRRALEDDRDQHDRWRHKIVENRWNARTEEPQYRHHEQEPGRAAHRGCYGCEEQ